MSKSDAAIVARWTVKLKIREGLLAFARREVTFWRNRKAKAKPGTAASSHANKMLVSREAKVAKREAQVSQARRVIARHRGHHPETVKGIDVSNNNGTVNFDLVKKAGYDFAYLKATEGLTFKDAFFLDGVRRARGAGLKVGAYHFLHPGNAEGQAAVFAARLRLAGLGKGDLIPMVDVELNGVTAEDTRIFIAGVIRRMGLRCGIYTFPSFMHWPSTFGAPLWIANFEVPSPTIPGPWATYAIWQHSSNAHVPGVTGNCDVNVCHDLSKVIA